MVWQEVKYISCPFRSFDSVVILVHGLKELWLCPRKILEIRVSPFNKGTQEAIGDINSAFFIVFLGNSSTDPKKTFLLS